MATTRPKFVDEWEIIDDEWEIIDNRGVVYSGFSEEETRRIFHDGDDFEWEGDVKLVQVHERMR